MSDDNLGAVGSLSDLSFVYAGFWLRLLAFLIDLFLIIGIPYFAYNILKIYFDFSVSSTSKVFYEMVAVFFWFLIYSPLMESSTLQGTIGKLLVGLIVTDENFERISFKRALSRNFYKIISVLTLYIGFLIIGFTSRKQGLHDKLSHCLVINRKSIEEFHRFKLLEKEQLKKGLEFYGGAWLPISEIAKFKEIKSLVDNNFLNYSPYDFEIFISNLFNEMGYKTTVTKKSGDFGVDVIAQNQNDTIAIQVKKYHEGNNVGNRDVQRLLGAMQLSSIRANKAILITTSDFTIQAQVQAEETPIELWNRKILINMVELYLINKKILAAKELQPDGTTQYGSSSTPTMARLSYK